MAKQVVSNGISLVGLLGVLFVGLKLAGAITWSWWWVTLPFWGGTAFAVVFAIVVLIILGIADIIGKSEDD